MGISSANVDEMLTSDDPNIQRLLGVAPGMGESMKINEEWAYNAIKQVGNYSEIFERSVGTDTPPWLPAWRECALDQRWSHVRTPDPLIVE